jgi:hypothetical protein
MQYFPPTSVNLYETTRRHMPEDIVIFTALKFHKLKIRELKRQTVDKTLVFCFSFTREMLFTAENKLNFIFRLHGLDTENILNVMNASRIERNEE